MSLEPMTPAITFKFNRRPILGHADSVCLYANGTPLLRFHGQMVLAIPVRWPGRDPIVPLYDNTRMRVKDFRTWDDVLSEEIVHYPTGDVVARLSLTDHSSKGLYVNSNEIPLLFIPFLPRALFNGIHRFVVASNGATSSADLVGFHLNSNRQVIIR